MKSLLGLFEETKDELDKIPEKHRKRMSRKRKYVFDNNVVPVIQPPNIESKEHKEDLEEVRNCYLNPSLQTGFLKTSANSVEKVFKEYCKTNGIRLDWKLISEILEDVDAVILDMKYKHMRPRPYVFLCETSDAFKDIRKSASPSFPSGHTAIAYFLSSLISHYYPDDRSDLEMLSALIGKSRIDNGVHYPSDVSYGRLTGEALCDAFLDKNHIETIDKPYTKKHDKKFAEFLQEKALERYAESESPHKEMRNLIADYLFRTNQIERYEVNYNDCLKSAEFLMQGIPNKLMPDDKHINAQCNLMKIAYFLKGIDSPYKMIRLHQGFDPRVLERGTPGEFRNIPHSSPVGHQYCEPEHLFKALRMLENVVDPYVRHIMYEWVHPFWDGNGRSGRMILLSDLDFDFEKILEFISEENYIPTLQSFMSENDIAKMIL